MEIRFLDAAATRRAIERLMREYDEFYWTVAWGTHPDHGETLLKHRKKFRSVTFGVAFSQTDPDLVEALIGEKNAYVVASYPSGTYHPKVYGFRSGAKAAAVIGSANFTGGGLEKNLEATVSITGDAGEPVFEELFAFIERAAEYRQSVDSNFADAYRLSCRRANRLKKPPREPVPPGRAMGPKPSVGPFLEMTWPSFRDHVHSRRGHHDIGKSLRLLQTARTWFASSNSFHDLSPHQQKAIAGVLGEKQKTDADLQQEWGWFGSMRGMGDFKNRIDRNDIYLARALDGIAEQGEVTREQFQWFVENFRLAFRNSHRRGGVATASRLLAMKRPDTFLCICGPNIARASRAMGFSPSTLDLDNYWDRVVEVVRLSEWYNAPRPHDEDRALWEGRVAMLDAIFYRPRKRAFATEPEMSRVEKAARRIGATAW